MISLIFKRYAFRSQIRQFSTVLIHNRNQNERKVNQHPKVYYRLFSSTPNERCMLPPLINLATFQYPTVFGWLTVKIAPILIRYTIDRTFDIDEFSAGVLHAIKVISRSLASQNYEALNGLVTDDLIQMLKGSVNQLTDSQRELIAVGEKSVWFTNTYATARNSKSDYDHILEITQFGVYVPLNTPNNKSISKNLTTFNYTFQRKYSDGIGGPWVAILVNHFTPMVPF